MRINREMILKMSPCPVGYATSEALVRDFETIDRDDFFQLLMKHGHSAYANWLIRHTNTLEAVLLTGGVATGSYLTNSKHGTELAKLRSFEHAIEYRDQRIKETFTQNEKQWFATVHEEVLANGDTRWKPVIDFSKLHSEPLKPLLVFNMYSGSFERFANSHHAIQRRNELIVKRMWDFKSAIFKEFKNPYGDVALELISDITDQRIQIG